MDKIICRLAMMITVVALAGCGLKGPLYFPNQEKPQTSQPKPSTQQADTHNGQQDDNTHSSRSAQ